MTHPIVRFAPSPTGRLHVGNVRTALINWLFAQSQGGKFILRIDDTDIERSTKAYEDGLREDLTWLGLVWAETFSQSDRFGEYDKAAARLKEMGLLYACYESADELERKRKIALSRGRPPVYDRASLDLSDDEKAKLEADGVKPHWRFKLSGNRVEWDDLVRGPQSIDTSSLSDPVLIREDGSYLYTLPSVVDDIDAKITHVVRGEDHVTNSGAQIEIFHALGGTAPKMAHTTAADRRRWDRACQSGSVHCRWENCANKAMSRWRSPACWPRSARRTMSKPEPASMSWPRNSISARSAGLRRGLTRPTCCP